MSDSEFLDNLGWANYLSKTSIKLRSADTVGRIISEHKNHLTVLCEKGELSATLPGSMIRDSENENLPAVGDWVILNFVANENKAVVKKVLPRFNKLSRTDKKLNAQILAINIDFVFIVQSLQFTIREDMIEGFLALAYQAQATPIIVLNKTDQAEQAIDIIEKLTAQYSVTTIFSNALSSEGINKISAIIETGKTAVIIGPSGVGKSTIINSLTGEATQSTGQVRQADFAGKHTTTRRELIMLPTGGNIIDTPGIRSLEGTNDERSVTLLYPELQELSKQCKFRNCEHVKSAGCALIEALEKNKISKGKYDRFLALTRPS